MIIKTHRIKCNIYIYFLEEISQKLFIVGTYHILIMKYINAINYDY